MEVLGYLDRDGKVVKARIGSAVSASTGAGLLASADFHGMEVEVVRCADAGRVGLRGIVVRETRSTITVVCDEREDLRRARRKKGWRRKMPDGKSVDGQQQDKVRMILKKGTVFRVAIALPTRDDNETNTNIDADDGADTEMEDGQVTPTAAKRETRKADRQLIFEIHGDQLEIRPVERAVKKFKWKAMDYL